MKNSKKSKTLREYMEELNDFDTIEQEPTDDLDYEASMGPKDNMSVSVGFNSELPGETGEMEGSMTTKLSELGAEVINLAQEIQNSEFEGNHISDIDQLESALNSYHNSFNSFCTRIEEMQEELREYKKNVNI